MTQVPAMLHYLQVRGSKQDALYTDRMTHDLVYHDQIRAKTNIPNIRI